jgi:formamidopyrimidine-DNA glycosylase
MPELPEVETVCRALRPHLTGARLVAVRTLVSHLRTPLDGPALERACRGRAIVGVRRRAKYLLIDLEGGRQALLLHLGMTGACRICAAAEPLETHARVVWRLADGREWRFIDARRFGRVSVCELRTPAGLPPELDGCGIEPLEDGFTGECLWHLTRGRAVPIKCLIMDQRLVAGVGNIYANEACFRAGVRPGRAARTLSRRACTALAREIRAVLEEAILCGGTTISDFQSVDGEEGRFHVALDVYGRTGASCTRCGERSRVRRSVLGGRSTFACRRCQR